MSSTPAFVRVVAAACAVVAWWSANAEDRSWNTSSPVETVTTLQLGLTGLARGQTSAFDENLLTSLIGATHDLPYIAEFALRRQWGSLAEDDRQRFIEAFQRLSVMTYATRFEAVGADTFRPVTAGEPDANGRVLVSTAVARVGQPDVSLEYLLHKGEPWQGWRIINIVADGVSDLALKRAEYQRVFASGGIDGLVAELEAQTERLQRE